VKLGLGLVQQVVLLRLCYADEDPKLRVELQDAALQVGNEVAKAPNAANPNNRLQRSRQAITSHVSPRGLWPEPAPTLQLTFLEEAETAVKKKSKGNISDGNVLLKTETAGEGCRTAYSWPESLELLAVWARPTQENLRKTSTGSPPESLLKPSALEKGIK